MGLLAKILITSWIKNHEKQADKTSEAVLVMGEKTAEALNHIAVELAKFGVKMGQLERAAEVTSEYGKSIAVMEVRLADFGKCLNGLGQKVKRLES